MNDPINRPPIEDAVYEDLPEPPRKPAQQARIEAAANRLERERADLAAVLRTEPGQAFVMRLLEQCGIYRTTLVSSDVTQYAVAEGRRALGLWLVKQISQIAPTAYPQLLINHQVRQQAMADTDAAIARNPS